MPQLHRIGAIATAMVLIATGLLCSTAGLGAEPAPAHCTGTGSSLRYVVLFDPATSHADADDEVDGQCGSLTAYYPEIGVGVADADDGFGARLGHDRAYSARGELREHEQVGHQSVNNSTSDRHDQAAEQWNMAQIHADQARASARGDDVVVGVLDSGIDPRHPELADALDPTLSADCLKPESEGGSLPPANSPHGTHVAGIIAAADDGRGVTGVAPGARLASIRVVDGAGYVHPEYAVCGFMRAVDIGARVVNSSFLVESAQQGCADGHGSPVPREAVRRAVAHATSQGVLTVAATGNERVDLSAVYGKRRANCDAVPVGLDGVLSVAAVDDAELKAGYSSYGLGAVDVAAPGGDGRPDGTCVLSTVPGSYGRACGTSMAAPHVSGVAALVASQRPDAGPAELTRLLTERSDPMGCPTDYDLNADAMQDALCKGYAAYNGFYGHGLINARNAVAR